MTAYFSQPPHTIVQFDIVRDADWNDALPPLKTGGAAMDLTGMALEMHIRPTDDHSVLLARLVSEGAGGIIIDDAANGLATIYVERPDVIDLFPVGEWQQFMLLREPTGDQDGFAYREIWRGPLIVHAGKID